MRRTVGEIGEYRDYRSWRAAALAVCDAPAFEDRAVEVRYHRHDEVGPPLLPKSGQQRHVLRMHSPDQELGRAEHRPGADSQTVLEQSIVQILDPDAGDVVEDVDRFQYFAQIHHPD